nr:mannosylglycoprotein endo-beta-mannosidase [Ipomoea batatas]
MCCYPAVRLCGDGGYDKSAANCIVLLGVGAEVHESAAVEEDDYREGSGIPRLVASGDEDTEPEVAGRVEGDVGGLDAVDKVAVGGNSDVEYLDETAVHGVILVATGVSDGGDKGKGYAGPPWNGGLKLDLRRILRLMEATATRLCGIPPEGGQGGDHEIAKDVAAQYVEGWDWMTPISSQPFSSSFTPSRLSLSAPYQTPATGGNFYGNKSISGELEPLSPTTRTLAVVGGGTGDSVGMGSEFAFSPLFSVNSGGGRGSASQQRRSKASTPLLLSSPSKWRKRWPSPVDGNKQANEAERCSPLRWMKAGSSAAAVSIVSLSPAATAVSSNMRQKAISFLGFPAMNGEPERWSTISSGEQPVLLCSQLRFYFTGAEGPFKG